MLTIPQAGGGLEPSRNYDILLPPEPRAGQLVRYKLSQQVEPGTSDRFTVRMDQPEPERQLGIRLYQLEVLLYHDTATAPLKAGTALVATPYVPDKLYFATGIPPDLRAGYKGSDALGTMQTNEATLRRMLALDGERAAGLDADLVDVPVTGKEPTPCLPSGKRRPVPSAQAPLSEP